MGPSCMWGNRNQGRPSLFHCRPWTSKALESTASSSPPTWTLLASQAELLTDFTFSCVFSSLLSFQLPGGGRVVDGGSAFFPHTYTTQTHTHTLHTHMHTRHTYTHINTHTHIHTLHIHIFTGIYTYVLSHFSHVYL